MTRVSEEMAPLIVDDPYSEVLTFLTSRIYVGNSVLSADVVVTEESQELTLTPLS
jgi:hypothetical protein